jgi:hypothetical protein
MTRIEFIKAYAAAATQLANLPYALAWFNLGVALADAITYADNGYTPAEIVALRNAAASDSYAPERDELAEAAMRIVACRGCNARGILVGSHFSHVADTEISCPDPVAGHVEMTYLAWRDRIAA